jgi:uncharacterized protein (TIGR04255 family)
MAPLASASGRQVTAVPVRRHYDRAPIQEALIEVKFEPRPELTIETLMHLDHPEDAVYSSRSPLFDGQVNVRFEQGTAVVADSSSAPAGQQFIDPTRNEAIRVRLDGYSYHKLARYTSWEDWTPRAFAMLERYVTAATPPRATSVAVRYVNRLELPQHSELKDYLLTSPDIAPGLPQMLDGYAMQVAIPWDDGDTKIVIRQATVPLPAQDLAAILLDIAVSRMISAAPEPTALRATAEQLHAIEIEVFERCITNRTREIIG